MNFDTTIDLLDNKYYIKNEKLHREDGPAVEYKDGGKEWWVNGKLHRTDGPAVKYVNGFKAWYINGELHRLDGPAIEFSNGSKNWYKNGEFHREDGPAIINANGDKIWYLNGLLHREDGPAVERVNGDKEWYINNKKHRIDGPAVINGDGEKYWWFDGGYYTEEEFNNIVDFPNLKTPYVFYSEPIYHVKFKEDIGIRLFYSLELYINGEFIKGDEHVKEIILQFLKKSNRVEPLLDWIQENNNYFPNEFIERLFY